ncbi:MAG: helix-turn-helix domain-containing protein [Streptosporangiaceae bacterium]
MDRIVAAAAPMDARTIADTRLIIWGPEAIRLPAAAVTPVTTEGRRMSRAAAARSGKDEEPPQYRAASVVNDPGCIDVGLDSLRLLTVPQVADLLSVSSKTVRRLISSGELKSVRIGTAVRIAPEDLAAYIAALRGQSGQSG